MAAGVKKKRRHPGRRENLRSTNRTGKKGATPAQRQGRRRRPAKKPRKHRKLTPEEVAQEERRTRAIALYRTGKHTQDQIAAILGVNQSTISRDLGHLVHERFPAEQEADVAAYREREVRVADAVAEEAWKAWDRPSIFGGPDSRHLRNVLAASVQRCKVQGTYAPTKVSATVDLSELLGRAIDDEHGAHTR